MGVMPYHLEKGHYLLLIEATLNEGIEEVVDNDAAITFPGLRVGTRCCNTCVRWWLARAT